MTSLGNQRRGSPALFEFGYLHLVYAFGKGQSH